MSNSRRIMAQCLSGVIIALCIIAPVESAYPPFRGLEAIEENPLQILTAQRSPTPWRWQFTNIGSGLNALPDLLSRFTASSKAIERFSYSPAVLNDTAEFLPLTPLQLALTTRDLSRIASDCSCNALAYGWHDFSLPTWTTIEQIDTTGTCPPSATECATPPQRELSASPTSVSNLGALLLMGSGLLSLAAHTWHQGRHQPGSHLTT